MPSNTASWLQITEHDEQRARELINTFVDHGFSRVSGMARPSDNTLLFAYLAKMKTRNEELEQQVVDLKKGGTVSKVVPLTDAGKAVLDRKNDEIAQLQGIIAERDFKIDELNNKLATVERVGTPIAAAIVPLMIDGLIYNGPYLSELAALPMSTLRRVVRLVKEDQKIQALKMLREAVTSSNELAGLRQAKDVIDHMAREINAAASTSTSAVGTVPVSRAEFDELVARLRTIESHTFDTISAPEKAEPLPLARPAVLYENETTPDNVTPRIKPRPPAGWAEVEEPKAPAKPTTIVIDTPATPAVAAAVSKTFDLGAADKKDGWLDTLQAFQLLGGKGKDDGSTIVEVSSGKNLTYKTFRMRSDDVLRGYGFEVNSTARAMGQKGWLKPTADLLKAHKG